MFGKYFLVTDAARGRRAGQGAGIASAVLSGFRGFADLCMIGPVCVQPASDPERAKAKSMATRSRSSALTRTGKRSRRSRLARSRRPWCKPFMYGYKSVEALAAKAVATIRSW